MCADHVRFHSCRPYIERLPDALIVVLGVLCLEEVLLYTFPKDYSPTVTISQSVDTFDVSLVIVVFDVRYASHSIYVYCCFRYL